MLPGRAIQPLNALEIDRISLGMKLLTNIKYLLLDVDKASRFPLALPPCLEQVDGATR